MSRDTRPTPPDAPSCFYCGGKEGEKDAAGDEMELRPYGPGGAWLCYECMKATPEREAEAGRQFVAQLDAAGPVVVIGESTGPRPLDGGKDG